MQSKVIQLYKHIYPVSNSFQIIFIRKRKVLSHVRLFVTLWTVQSVEFSRPEYWSGSLFPSPGDLCNPGIEPRSPALQVDPLPTEPHGKPKNTGVESLSLLQWIFPTQESNRGLLHCRWFLYQLSYQGNPSLLRGISRILCAVNSRSLLVLYFKFSTMYMLYF